MIFEKEKRFLNNNKGPINTDFQLKSSQKYTNLSYPSA